MKLKAVMGIKNRMTRKECRLRSARDLFRLTSMSPPFPVRVRVSAGVREPEDSRNFEILVLRVLAPGNGALRHTDLEVPPLLAEEPYPLRPLAGRLLRGGAGTVFARRVGHLGDARRRRYRRRQLHLVGPDVSRELVMIIGMDEIVQGLTQQLVLQQQAEDSLLIFGSVPKLRRSCVYFYRHCSNCSAICRYEEKNSSRAVAPVNRFVRCNFACFIPA